MDFFLKFQYNFMNQNKKEDFQLFTLGECAKLLNLGFGRNVFINYLRKWKILMSEKNVPYQRMISLGYAEFRLVKIETRNGKVLKIPTTLVTIKGLYFFEKLLDNKLKKAK